MKKSLILAATAVVALALVAGAFAGGGSILKGYGGEAGKALKGTAPKATAVHGGTLPFTGLDLGLAAGGAALLILTGAAMRRAGRDKT